MAKSNAQSDIGYADAMAEIEKILTEINSPNLDIDTLSQKVTRANKLLEICKSKLLKTQTEVEKIISDK